MSYALMAYRANAKQIQSVQNCHNQALFDSLVDANQHTITANARWFRNHDNLLTIDQALHHVIFDEPMDNDFGFQYGYAYKMIVAHYGTLLHTNGFEIIDFDDFNEALYAAGLFALDLFTFTGAGTRWQTPKPQNFPYIGYIDEAQVDTLRTQLNNVDETLNTTWLADIHRWFTELKQGDMIVGIYH